MKAAHHPPWPVPQTRHLHQQDCAPQYDMQRTLSRLQQADECLGHALQGLLEGAVFHWGIASREGSLWVPPPSGWQSDPAQTIDTGESSSRDSCCVPMALPMASVSARTCKAVHGMHSLQLPLHHEPPQRAALLLFAALHAAAVMSLIERPLATCAPPTSENRQRQ